MNLSAVGLLELLAAGLFAGTINTIVGSGSLVTFPTLLALGYSPLVANVSNTEGLVPGSLSGAIGYRRELRGQRRRGLELGACAALGGLLGAVLLLRLPALFQAVVPWLILLAVAMVAAQPRLAAARAKRGPRPQHGGWWVRIGVFATGIYGGYFGAAQGVLLIGILGLGIDDDLQRLNGLKNVLAGTVNAVAAIVFALFSPVAWAPAAVLALGSILGGQLGARFGRRLPAPLLRGIIIVGGLAVALKLLL